MSDGRTRLQSLEKTLRSERTNATLAWALVGVILLVAIVNVGRNDILWATFATASAAIALVPPVAFRSSRVMVPWEVIGLAAVSIVVRGFLADPTLVTIATYLAVAAIALIVAVELHVFTEARMNHSFAVLFVVMVTVTASGTWTILQWVWDLIWGTELITSNDQVMWRFITVTAVGIGAGILFDRYAPRLEGERVTMVGAEGGIESQDGEEESPDDTDDSADEMVTSPDEKDNSPDEKEAPETDGTESRLSDAIGISDRSQRHLVRTLQIGLFLALVYGLVTLDVATTVNGAIGLGATFLPGVLEREYDLPMDPGLTLWISTAVFLHVVGTMWLYGDVGWYHNLTHAFSATLIGGIGYASARAVDEHTTSIYLPQKLMFAFVVLFVFSIGVFWEILEFTLDGIAAAVGTDGIALAQHGLEDTMTDLVFNTIGAIVVATWGVVYLRHVASAMGDHLDEEAGDA